VRRELENKIAVLTSRWWQVWINDDVLERVRDQVKRLDRISEGLTRLSKKAEKLAAEAQQLEDNASVLDDHDLSNWFAVQSSDWEAQLARIGVDSDRESELFHEQIALERIEDELRFHHQALYWLR
jgi:hypothetical protein